MLPNYEIQLVPSGMTIYNPPMSDDAFNPAIGSITNYNQAAREICEGAGKLAQNKRDYIAYALQLANQRNNVSGWNEVINGLENAKTTEGCEWGAKRGRVAEVIRVLKRERDKWVKAKEGIGTPVVDRVYGRTKLTAPNWNPTTADWALIAKDLGDKLLTKQEIVSILKSKISIQLAKENNAGIIEAQKIYDGSINGLEQNKNSVAWGVKRSRVNAAIRYIKSTIRRPETLVDIVSQPPANVPTTGAEEVAETWLERLLGGSTPPDVDSGSGGEPENKPDYTPLLAGGGVVVAVILIGVLVSAASKGKQGTLQQ